MLNEPSIHVYILTSNALLPHATTLAHLNAAALKYGSIPTGYFGYFGRWLSDVGYCAASTWYRLPRSLELLLLFARLLGRQWHKEQVARAACMAACWKALTLAACPGSQLAHSLAT